MASFLEIPAGMLDGSGHFSGVAAKEMKEETGLDIDAHELIDLTALAYGLPSLRGDEGGGPSADAPSPAGGSFSSESTGGSLSSSESGEPYVRSSSPSQHASAPRLRGMYPSVGACDEFLRLLYFSKDVTAAQLDELQGRATGNMEEGEVITLEVVPLEQLWRLAPDAKTLASILLLEKLTAAGLIKA